VKSILGEVEIGPKQAKKLGLESKAPISPRAVSFKLIITDFEEINFT
jgi:hypothetical protein